MELKVVSRMDSPSNIVNTEENVFSSIDVRAALRRGIALLRDANISSYTLAAELLLLHVVGRDRTWLYAHPEEVLEYVKANLVKKN